MPDFSALERRALSSLDPPTLAALLAQGAVRSVEAGALLFRQGDPGEELYGVMAGSFDVVVDGRVVDVIGTGELIGEMSLLFGVARTATLRARERSRVVAWRADRIQEQVKLSRSLPALARLRMLEASLLATFRSLLGEAPKDLVLGASLESLQRGEALFERGDPSPCWYIVLSGSLEAVVETPTPRRRAIGPGDVVGELGALTGQARSGTVRARRDSWVARFDDDHLRDHPLLVQRLMLRALPTLVEPPPPPRSKLRVAIVALGDPREVQPFVRGLSESLDSALVVDPARLAREHVLHDARERDENHPGWIRVDAWLRRQEETHDTLLLVVEDVDSGWADQALNQADHVLWLGPGAPNRLFDSVRGLPGLRQSLVRVDGQASGTAALLERLGLEEVLHADTPGDLARVARLVSGQPVVGVLGGGGARAYAHLGVAKALEEAGVEVDAWCGTSMGAVMAAALAMGGGVDDAIERARPGAMARPMGRVGLPYSSLFQTEPVEAAYRDAFGALRIEELRKPFACLSVSLSRSRPVVHRRGELVPALRATSAAPGLLAPVWVGGELLVDGGIWDNLPVVMAQDLWGGKTLAVSVGGEPDLGEPGAEVPGWTEVAASWFGLREAPRSATTVSVVVASVTVASSQALEEARRRAHRFLEPPVQEFSLVASDAIDALVQVGYAHTLELLEREALFP